MNFKCWDKISECIKNVKTKLHKWSINHTEPNKWITHKKLNHQEKVCDNHFTLEIASADKNPIFFVHIPKTAGTSFRKAAEIYYGLQETCKDYGVESKETYQIVHDLILKNQDPWNFKKKFTEAGYNFFSGHVQARQYIHVFNIENTVTFFRDPLQRINSEYFHFVNYNSYINNLREFYTTETFINKQSKMLQGIPWSALGFVGITERYDESLNLFNNQFGVDFPIFQENLGKENITEKHKINPEQERELRELNAEDIQLYEQACRHFEWRVKLANEHKVFTRGMIGGFDNKCLNGWAVYDKGDEPVKVEIEVNGKSVGCAVACHVRPYLKALGIRRGGFIGFSIEIPFLAPSDEVTAYVADTGQPLANSPWRYSV